MYQTFVDCERLQNYTPQYTQRIRFDPGWEKIGERTSDMNTFNTFINSSKESDSFLKDENHKLIKEV